MTADSNSRILVASRSKALMAALRSGRLSGAHIDIASSAPAVMDWMHSPNVPALLLLDPDLPGIDVGQLVAAMRSEKDFRQFPIVLVPESVSPEWLNSALRAFGNRREPEQMAASPQEPHSDPLTGLHNRASMLAMLFRETDRVQRMKTSLSVMLFAIDGFGEWQVRLGAAASADLLRQVVERVRRLLRSYDLFGRIGGCEFALGLPGCSLHSAVSLAGRIRTEVFSAPFSVSGTQLHLSAEFAIAFSEGRSPVVVLREAEGELYNARATHSIRVSHQRHCPKP